MIAVASRRTPARDHAMRMHLLAQYEPAAVERPCAYGCGATVRSADGLCRLCRPALRAERRA